jgi:hypothetical protein
LNNLSGEIQYHERERREREKEGGNKLHLVENKTDII